MLGLASSLVKGGASLLTFVKDNLKLYLDFKKSRSDTLAFPSEGSTSFDGSGNRIKFGQIDVSGQNITLSAWVYRDGTTDDVIAGRWSTNGAMLYCSGGDVRWYINSGFAATTIPDKTWVHIVGTFDGLNRKIYKDGVLKDKDADTSTIVNPSQNFEIGNAEYHGSVGFKGKLANVGLWSRALSSEEVQSVMNKSYSQLGSVEKTSLVSWWALDSQSDGLVQPATGEVLGTNLFTDSTFDLSGTQSASTTGTHWTTGNSWTIGNGEAIYDGINNESPLSLPSATFQSAGLYKLSFTISDASSHARIKIKADANDIVASASYSNGDHVIYYNQANAYGSAKTLKIEGRNDASGSSFKLKNASWEFVTSNTGLVTGATTTTSVYGGNAPILPRAIDIAESFADKIGNGSANFTIGDTDYIEIKNTGIILQDWSISFWARTGANLSGSFPGIVSTRSGTNEDYSNGVTLHYYNDYFDAEGASFNGHLPKVAGNTGLDNGEWYHIVFTSDRSGQNKQYINGIFITQESSANIQAHADIIQIGARFYSNTVRDFWDGDISQVGFWQGILDQSKVQKLYESTSYQKIPADVKSTLGSDELPSPDLTSGTGLTIVQGSTGALTHDTSAGTITATNDVQDGYLRWNSASLVENKLYKLEIVVDSYTGGRFRTTLGWNGTSFYPSVGTNIQYFIGSSTASFGIQIDDGNPAEFVISRISVKEVINDIVAYYPLDADSSNTSNGVGITNDVTTGETLGNDITSASTWINSSSSPYETFVSSGNSITNAINTSGFGIIYTSDFSLTSGKLYKISFDMNISSGSIDHLRIAQNTNMDSGLQLDKVPTNGTNIFYIQSSTTASSFKFGFRGNDAVAFSMSNLLIKEVTSNTGVLK